MFITKEQLDLIPPVVRRRMTDKDFQLLDDIIHNNKRFGVEMGFDEYFDVNLHDSLHEFIQYKVAEIDPNLGDDSWDREENNTYVIFRKLFPFLNEKYHDDLYEYYMEKNRRHRNINESQYEKIQNQILNSIKKNGFYETMNAYKLNIKSLHKIFGEGNLPKFDCRDLYQIFSYFVFKNLVQTEFKIKKNESISFYTDSFSGTNFFRRKFKDLTMIDGYATPYFDGNCNLPLDADFYVYNINDDEEPDEVDIVGEYQEYVKLPKQWNSFMEIKNWLENDYVKILIDYTNNVYDKLGDYSD
jgi:hypothetical protein